LNESFNFLLPFDVSFILDDFRRIPGMFGTLLIR